MGLIGKHDRHDSYTMWYIRGNAERRTFKRAVQHVTLLCLLTLPHDTKVHIMPSLYIIYEDIFVLKRLSPEQLVNVAKIWIYLAAL